MTSSTAKLLDVVALTADLPQHNLCRGQVGTVVETLANGAAFEVEFSDRNGRTYESVGLRSQQMMVLRFEPAAPDEAEMVTASAAQRYYSGLSSQTACGVALVALQMRSADAEQ